MEPLLCFPEPAAPDERPMLRHETRAEFLHRSTWSRAVETRAFYNDALAALPERCADQLCRRLASTADDTEAPTFELIVGRFLQLRGASELECEPEGARRRVDWRATFPDAVLHVEAMVPVYNASMGVTVRKHQRLLDVVEARVPEGWWVIAGRLPALSESAPLAPFTRLIDELIAQLPPAHTVSPDDARRLEGRLSGADRAEVALIAAPATSGPGGLGGGAIVGGMDDSRLRVAAAWADRRKRSQGRSVPPPAVLAVQGSFGGADLDDFQNALFGLDASLGRPADGVMARDPDPPWAGVLAFPRVSPAAVADPVLFVAPRYDGGFPETLNRLEVRRLADGGVAVQEARDRDVMASMRWAALD